MAITPEITTVLPVANQRWSAVIVITSAPLHPTNAESLLQIL
jgi:hypothetical protein